MISFFSLPLEIRRKIYSLILDFPSDGHTAATWKVLWLSPRNIEKTNSLSSLNDGAFQQSLRVSRQFNNELMECLWSQYNARLAGYVKGETGDENRGVAFHIGGRALESQKARSVKIPLGVRYLTMHFMMSTLWVHGFSRGKDDYVPEHLWIRQVLLKVADDLNCLQEMTVEIYFTQRISPQLWHATYRDPYSQGVNLLLEMFLPLSRIDRVNIKLDAKSSTMQIHDRLFNDLQTKLSEWAWVFDRDTKQYLPPVPLRVEKIAEANATEDDV